MPFTKEVNKYKNENGSWKTGQLFQEHYTQYKEQFKDGPIFSLDRDIPGLINARKTWLELGDPTGYKWAVRYLSWPHYEYMLKSVKFFREAVTEWLQELKIKAKAEAVEKIRLIALGASGEPAATVLAANRYLASSEWERSVGARGRPSKEEMKGALKQAVDQLTQEDQDAQRIGLTVINGGKE